MHQDPLGMLVEGRNMIVETGQRVMTRRTAHVYPVRPAQDNPWIQSTPEDKNIGLQRVWLRIRTGGATDPIVPPNGDLPET